MKRFTNEKISRRDDPPSDTMSKASIVEEYLRESV